LRLLKAEGRGSSRQFQLVYPEKEIIITPFFTHVMTEFFLGVLERNSNIFTTDLFFKTVSFLIL